MSNRLLLATLRSLGTLITRSGRSARLPILIYHRVLSAPDPMFPDLVDARRFEQQVTVIADYFTILPLSVAVAMLRDGQLPPRSACITFDDGYADNRHVALPVLLRLGVPATFFVSTGFLTGESMWNDNVIHGVRHAQTPTADLTALGLGRFDVGSWPARRATVASILDRVRYLPAGERNELSLAIAEALTPAPIPAQMMNADDVRDLHAAGMEIGAHTITHPILAKLAGDAAREEIEGGKRHLEAIVGGSVSSFAYPNGRPGTDYRAEHVALVAASGFSLAVTTAWGSARPDSDPFQLPRFTPWDQDPLRFVLRLYHNLAFNDAVTVGGA